MVARCRQYGFLMHQVPQDVADPDVDMLAAPQASISCRVTPLESLETSSRVLVTAGQIRAMPAEEEAVEAICSPISQTVAAHPTNLEGG